MVLAQESKVFKQGLELGDMHQHEQTTVSE